MQLPNGFDPLCNFIASVKIFQKHCWSQYMSYFCKKYVGPRYISYTCVWNVGSHTRISTCILFKSLTKKRRQENELSDTWLKKSLTEKWNSVMVFCFQNCSSDRENIRGWRPRICKRFDITGTIYSNSERSEQFLKQNVFLTYFETDLNNQ